MMEKEVLCPHCREPLSFEVIARLTKQSQVKWTIQPMPGELIDAKTVGGTLSSVRDLFKAFGKEVGVPTDVLVQKISTTESGALEFDLIITRFDLPTERAKRFRRKIREGLAP